MAVLPERDEVTSAPQAGSEASPAGTEEAVDSTGPDTSERWGSCPQLCCLLSSLPCWGQRLQTQAPGHQAVQKATGPGLGAFRETATT